MCLIYAVFFFVGPHAGLALWWLLDQSRFNLVYNNFFLPLIGFVFLPVTTIMYTLVWRPTGLDGWGFFWMALALFGDIAAYAPGGYSSNRNRLMVALRSRGGSSAGTPA
jgi:hypothetical protein